MAEWLPAEGGSAYGGKAAFDMACVYVFFSEKRKIFYKGSTRDNCAQSRLDAHNKGTVRSTKAGLPWKLLYFEVFPDYTAARKREIFLKSGAGRKWIKENWERWLSG